MPILCVVECHEIIWRCNNVEDAASGSCGPGWSCGIHGSRSRLTPMSDQLPLFDPYHHWLSIPPEQQPPNYYQLIGVAVFEDNREVISNAADLRMAYVRTFQLGKRSSESQQLLNELSAAAG